MALSCVAQPPRFWVHQLTLWDQTQCICRHVPFHLDRILGPSLAFIFLVLVFGPCPAILRGYLGLCTQGLLRDSLGDHM